MEKAMRVLEEHEIAAVSGGAGAAARGVALSKAADHFGNQNGQCADELAVAAAVVAAAAGVAVVAGVAAPAAKAVGAGAALVSAVSAAASMFGFGS
ncbi:hypothetical protein L2D00_02340 [Hyphomonadaceae bacterium BL14]|nr:hypothetical protein L2D00_02340 [Hyphomonadaceae bacterium BL14]